MLSGNCMSKKTYNSHKQNHYSFIISHCLSLCFFVPWRLSGPYIKLLNRKIIHHPEFFTRTHSNF